ncbi:MAG: NAD(P)/FAD-dependent oxidoreductase [Opitutaceae bacterium]|jgi:thioredoxin reductase|nr:NAD(P)/FAD-dependent oxidoreductase [Opitutaceae bacterium]
MKKHYQVIIIGAGPAGIAVATSLKKAGVDDLVILERENAFGGAPRHCLHPTFGLQTFWRPMTGRTFIKKIRARAPDAAIATSATVVALKAGGELSVSLPEEGLLGITGERVVIATGARETPRHPRLVGGLRPRGVMTAGALQQFIYLGKRKPFSSPVVVGSEVVGFSALWTLKNAGIKAVAMIEPEPRLIAPSASSLCAAFLGVKIRRGTEITRIGGLDRVEYIDTKDRAGNEHRIACDGVIFTGRFVGENTLVRESHLAHDPAAGGAPVTDQFGRCSDPAYFAAGNMLHPADMGDQCYQEGLVVGRHVADSLRNRLPDYEKNGVPVNRDPAIRLVTPGRLITGAGIRPVTLNMRVARPVKGDVIVSAGDRILYRKRHDCKIERRILLKNLPPSAIPAPATAVELKIIPVK